MNYFKGIKKGIKKECSVHIRFKPHSKGNTMAKPRGGAADQTEV